MTDLDDILARASRDIARQRMPNGWKASPDAPSTLEECTRFFRQHNTVHVTDYFDPRTSIFSCPVSQEAFQAWHDYAHVTLQAGFDKAGERRVNDQQSADFNEWFRRNAIRNRFTMSDYNRSLEILRAHNLGRLDYWDVMGDAPDNFRQFASGYLTARNVI